MRAEVGAPNAKGMVETTEEMLGLGSEEEVAVVVEAEEEEEEMVGKPWVTAGAVVMG